MIPYITLKIPREYIYNLERSNKNKYHAFNEWLIKNEEVSFGLLNKMPSISFFAKSWGMWERDKCIKPKSTQTVRNWIKEFEMEMEKFDANWALDRWQRSARARKKSEKSVKNSSVKKPTAQRLHTDCTDKPSSNNYIVGIEESGLHTDCTPTAPIINIYDDDGGKKILREFEELFFVYRAFNAKYAGKKLEALEAYKEWRKTHPVFSLDELKRAIKLYMHDNEIVKKNGFKSFFLNELYFSYVDKRVFYKHGNTWIKSIWNSVDEILYYANEPTKPIGLLNRERFNTLLESGDIKLDMEVA